MGSKVFWILIILSCTISCSKEGELTRTPDNGSSTENSFLLKSGEFIPTAGISVSGSAEIRMSTEGNFVKLSNFKVSSGPDLKVYLSKKDTPSDFVNLGALDKNKSVYSIPGTISVKDYPYVLIHCQQYNHLFAISKLN